MLDNIAAGHFLNGMVTADVVAMAVGCNNQLRILQVYAKAVNQQSGVFEVGDVTRIDQDGIIGTEDKVIGVEVSPFNKKQIGYLMHYPVPPYDQIAYRDHHASKEDFPITNQLSEEVL